MFERFTAAARAVVTAAREEAARTGAGEIREEHLLLGVVGRDSRAGRLLEHLGVGGAARPALRAEFGRIDRRWGLSDADARALAEIGIDLDQVADSVARSLGEETVTRRGPRAGLPRSGRLRSGRLRLTDGGKQTLALALRQATALGDGYLGDEHLLLALLARPGSVAEVLAAYGVTYGVVRSALAEERTAC